MFGASGCVALYRAEMLAQIGGFDSEFFAYLEDVDVAWRARAAGWEAFYEPAAVAHHRGSASTGEGSARKYRLVGRNRVRLLARNATTRQLARNLLGILLYDSAYILYVALSDRTLAPLRGRLAGLRGWRASRASNAVGPARGPAVLAAAQLAALAAPAPRLRARRFAPRAGVASSLSPRRCALRASACLGRSA